MHTQNKQHEIQVYAKLRHDIRSRFTLLIGVLDIMSGDEIWEAKRNEILQEKSSIERCLESILAAVQNLSTTPNEQIEPKALEIVHTIALPCLKRLMLLASTQHSPSSIESEWAETLAQEVEAFSRWCGGSSFIQDAISPQTTNQKLTNSCTNLTSETKLVVVIDDEPHNLEVVRMFLKKEDWQVLTFTSEKEVLHTLHSKNCNLILLDLNLNGVSGIEVLESIRGNSATKDIPVIMVTGSEDADALEACRQAGAASILAKPFGKAQLVELLKSILHS